MTAQPLDLTKLKILPLAERKSLTRADEILIDPDSSPPTCPARVGEAGRECRADDPRGPPVAARP